eukprot:scaffold3498_cov176-Amphora_coffeaeformis.AAC.18
MPGRKVSAKSVAAAGEAAAKLHPVDNKSKGAAPAGAAPVMKDSSKPNPKTSAPKKEVEYVEYKVGAEKPSVAPRRVKNDLKMLDTALVDSAVAKSQKGKNVKQIAPKKVPILPHHHGGPAPAKKPAVKPLAE